VGAVTIDAVLAFWFQGDPNRFRSDRWFAGSAEFDALCRARFSFAMHAALDGTLDNWTVTPEGTLALVILLDQFPRNIHRGSRLAFAGDAYARRIVRGAIAAGFDARLTPVERVFLYLPFEHSENLVDQDVSVRLFEAMRGNPQLEKTLSSARSHLCSERRLPKQRLLRLGGGEASVTTNITGALAR
jgi:uncharacterized protein (DUF924 family)